MFRSLLLLLLLSFSCDTGNLIVLADLPSSLNEVSAAQITNKSDLLWVIEDAGNENHLYGLNEKGKIIKDLVVINSKNKDWEDLTSDQNGNLYIGDFGNNSKKRKKFTILKIVNPENAKKEVTAEKIHFTLPKDEKSQDFEAIFLLDNFFYIFSKNDEHSKLFKIPNIVGDNNAKFLANFNLDGKHNKVTSADYYKNKIVLLNHEKAWLLSNFENEDFFKGDIKSFNFNHDSQKEGVCFKNDSTLYISDEYAGMHGGNLYEFMLD